MGTEALAAESPATLLQRIGPIWAQDINAHREQVVRAYTPLLAARPLAGLQVSRDLAYGEHARQVLDVYQPAAALTPDARLPIMVFVHGGAFLRGQKDSNAQVYGNVPRLFARHGYLGVNVEYRLAPEAPYPAGAQDVAAAVRWVRAHAERLGGDAQRIVLIGHSSGGAHVASYVCDPLCAPPQAEIAGAVLISARLRADVRADNPNAAGVRAYFGDDPAAYEAGSAVSHAARLKVPTLLAVAEFENPWLDVYAAEFCHRAGLALGRIPRLICVPEHNHTSIVAHLDIGDEDRLFGQQLLDFAAGLPPCPS
ncbi:alpha/beta hydrolase [Paucibacter sp. AS339]|uniref:alpha/beta hydrolase n=1 Tax=Paucibacter hankyongi TaxID=3133434 RepID=UPI00309E34E5